MAGRNPGDEEARLAAAYVDERSRKGFGPLRIRDELRRVLDVFEIILAPLARRLGYALIVTGTKGEAAS